MLCPSVDGRFVIIMRISSRSAQVHRPYIRYAGLTAYVNSDFGITK